jgi:hypothetical protein
LSSNTVVFVPCGFKDAYASLSWGGFSNFYEMCGGTVAVAANPVVGGTVTGGGTFEEGQTCTVMATAMEDFYFAKWTLNGMIVSYDPEYTFYAAGDMTLVAHFVPDGNIVFVDPNVKSICVSHLDTNGDGELSYIEAASVKSLDQAFKGNTDITSFDELQYFIGLTSIGGYDFSQCSGLATIVMPNSVASIKSYAFYKCTGLTSLTIGNTVISIGDCAFQNCSSMTGPLVIPDSVILIGYSAFRDCSGLTSLTIGNSVTSIENFAFYNCTGLTGQLVIPDSVTTLGSYTFYNCSSMSSLIIGNSVTSIGYSAFSGCRNFTGHLTIPNSVTSIGGYAFKNCSRLTSITIPNSVMSLGNYSFSGCSGLTGSLTIPNSVSSIGDFAFYGCNGISSMIVRAVIPPTLGGSNVFGNIPRTLPVYVPCGSAEAYQSAEYWSQFTNIQENCTQQTLTLSQGWNLISTYLADDPVEMLDMLKASLGENATYIQSMENMTEFDGEEWFGDLDEIGLENEKGYFVYVINDCTVELTGTPANVGDYEINISSEWNIIGFPSAEAIEVSVALAGFEAAEGDRIQTDYGMTEYNDGEWFGDMEMFEPGYGIMYFSNSNEDKPLVFQTGDSKARRNTKSGKLIKK